MYLFIIHTLVFFQKFSKAGRESCIHRSLARSRREDERDGEVFYSSGSSWYRHDKKEIASFSSFPFLVFSHFYDVGQGSRTIIRKVSLPSDEY